jgi:hypothetical protein
VQRIAALAAEKLLLMVAVNRPRWISPGGPKQLPDDLDDEKYIAIPDKREPIGSWGAVIARPHHPSPWRPRDGK